LEVLAKLLIPLTLCSAALAAGPPLPLPIVPNTAQERLQAQIAAQQAQAQARIAADQARVQAQLDANQARLEGQLATQQAGAQAQLDAARESAVTAAQVAALSLPVASAAPESLAGSAAGAAGTMQLTTLTPQLGRYFGTDRGVLVVRAPTHGVLKLEDGDVILSIGGRTPASPSQAMRILTSYDPGQKIRLVILREHHKLDITATMPPPETGP
jgi:S1-C subfamily serine protease